MPPHPYFFFQQVDTLEIALKEQLDQVSFKTVYRNAISPKIAATSHLWHNLQKCTPYLNLLFFDQVTAIFIAESVSTHKKVSTEHQL